ncbi:hypothetical protein ACJX0J_041029, partial [Zea mays]
MNYTIFHFRACGIISSRILITWTLDKVYLFQGSLSLEKVTKLVVTISFVSSNRIAWGFTVYPPVSLRGSNAQCGEELMSRASDSSTTKAKNFLTTHSSQRCIHILKPTGSLVCVTILVYWAFYGESNRLVLLAFFDVGVKFRYYAIALILCRFYAYLHMLGPENAQGNWVTSL